LFRADLGSPNNGNTPGTQPSGRREINWDGGGNAALATTFPIPMTTFSNRGAVFTTPGSGFEISGQPSPEFGDINPTYPDIFTTFSSPRLFTALGSNIVDVHFTVPGTTDVQALSRGFGAVFTDVDKDGPSSLAFYDAADNLLAQFSVPAFNNGLSFVGYSIDDPLIARVRITSGDTAVGPNDSTENDVVVLDDFLYGEPEPIPEPATWLLTGTAAALVLVRRLRRT
jgi:hypothetical protein